MRQSELGPNTRTWYDLPSGAVNVNYLAITLTSERQSSSALPGNDVAHEYNLYYGG
jgi:hypothetical protein